ncbi:MAG: chemotaxis-specific protein-glutamate methyltransferase CheB, partial [Spirochaetia bacterium]|nr:chemotaxis-specific protein-glutamate methyltransferase CheB [Spirochaetia bacterium]
MLSQMNKETAVATGSITVIIVDDSQVQRNLIRQVLSNEPGIEVVSQASNGRLALPRVRHYRPDLVILDQEMPEMTGLELLSVICSDYPDTGVIMYCSNTRESARVTLRALEMGALDFIAKPSMLTDGYADPTEYIKSVLVPRIKALAKRRAPHKPHANRSDVIHTPFIHTHDTTDVCAIGISTGGPAALRQLFERLPRGLNGSLLIVQHMPPLFTGFLAESLDSIGGIRAVEAKDGMTIEKGTAYIAPGGSHMTVEPSGVTLQITDTEAELNCKPSVNILFRSVARAYGPRALGVIMTGMGNDGCDGLR